MKKVSLFLALSFLWQCNLFTQEQIQSVKINIKQVEHPDIKAQNTFRINSKVLEFSPTYYQNGIVYVTAAVEGAKIDGNIGVPFFELFYAELDGEGMPSNPQSFSSKVNSPTHEGQVSFNFTEDAVFFTSNSNIKNSKGKKTMKIFQAQRGENEWENILELPFNGEEFHTMHPTLAATGMKLYFTSDRPGGYGGTDIYYIENFGNGWTEPVNLGPIVNTNKNEAFPFIHESGMLFFASEGHNGLGGYDIYTINTLDKTIEEIIHLGAPFNSENADFGLILNPTGTQGFFTSAHYGGLGQDDLYLFDAPNGLFSTIAPIESSANIRVVQESDGAPIPDASVYVFIKNKNGLFGEEDLYEVVLEAKEDNPDQMEVRFVMKKDLGKPNFYTNNEGLINTKLVDNQAYLLLITKKGYANKELRYDTYGQPTPINIQIPLTTKSCATLSGVIRNEKTKAVIPNSRIFIKSNCDGTIQFVSSNSLGQYEQCLPFGCEYILGAEKDGYAIGNITASTKNLTQSDLRRDIQLSPYNESINVVSNKSLSEGTTIVLENIYYDFNKSAIRTGAAEELNALVALMLQYPSLEVELIAHTDARGESAYNLILSKQRALAAKDYLSRRGIDAKRMTAIGRGEAEIRNHCLNEVSCSDKDHEYNRRTEVRVTKLSENVEIRYSGK